MSPLAGLRYVVTICSTSPGHAGVLHLTVRHAFAEDGSFASEILAGPAGALPDGPRGRAELIAEQGEALIFRSEVDGSERPSTTILTLHSAAAGEVFSTDGDDWVRGVAAIEALPAIAHEH